MGTKSDDYALSGLNYAHKLCIIKAKMTQIDPKRNIFKIDD